MNNMRKTRKRVGNCFKSTGFYKLSHSTIKKFHHPSTDLENSHQKGKNDRPDKDPTENPFIT